MKKLVLGAALIAAFGYGVGVGRYEWPPFRVLASFTRPPSERPALPRQASAHYAARVSLFRALPAGTADIVMVGDSLTEYGNWNELLSGRNILNRGIGWDIAQGVLARLPEIIARKPRAVALMIGVNDLQFAIPLDTTKAALRQIVVQLQAAGIKLVVQSVIHVGADHARLNPNIANLNTYLAALCREVGVPFLNLNPILAPAGRLNPEFTLDGIHLTGAAYGAWAAALVPLIEQP